MAKKDFTQGKVIAFHTARTRATPARMKAAANDSVALQGGFLDTWLKAHEDTDALIQENLALKNRQRRLERERDEMVASAPECVLYYTSLGIATCMLLAVLTAIYLQAA